MPEATLELFLPDVVARCALITHHLSWDAWTYAINRSSVDTTVLLSFANISLFVHPIITQCKHLLQKVVLITLEM